MTCRIWRLLTVVYNTQNHWAWGLCPSSSDWVSSFWETQQSRCLPPLTWGRVQINFPKRSAFWYLEFRTMDRVLKHSVLIHMTGCATGSESWPLEHIAVRVLLSGCLPTGSVLPYLQLISCCSLHSEFWKVFVEDPNWLTSHVIIITFRSYS
jgi:hypothetical protein